MLKPQEEYKQVKEFRKIHDYEKLLKSKKKIDRLKVGTLFMIIIVLTSFVIVYALYPSYFGQLVNANTSVISVPVNTKHPIMLGALLPLMGLLHQLVNQTAALKIAVKDVNDYFSKTLIRMLE